MGDKTSIEWTDATWNAVTGCAKVSSGCKNCYAERVFPRAYGKDRKFTDVQCHEDRLDQPLRWRKPRRVFVNSMSDLFHEDVPDAFIMAVFGVMAAAPHHSFQILTKRPERMKELLRDFCGSEQGRVGFFADQFGKAHRKYGVKLGPWNLTGQPVFSLPLPNVWLGVSVEDQATADERIPLLLETPAAVRFVSAEPLLGPVDLCRIPYQGDAPYYLDTLRGTYSTSPTRGGNPFAQGLGRLRPLDWVIVGGESGPNARPMHPAWARSLRDQCVAAGVAFHFKQWGEWSPVVKTHGCGRRVAGTGLREEPIFGMDGREVCASRFAGGIPDGFAAMARVGKKLAGRHLDGRTWDEFPEAKAEGRA